MNALVPVPAARDLPGFARPKWLAWETPRRAFNKRLDQLRKGRDDYFLGEWREIADNVSPRRGRFLTNGQDEKGKPRRSTQVVNITPALASRTLASGMMSGISSPARPWFKLGTADPKLNEYGDVKAWLEVVHRRLYRVMSKSNFYNSLHTVYGDLGDFGNASMVIDEDYEDVIRCTVFAPGEYYLDVSNRSAVNTVYREFKWTVLQCVEAYGDRCSTEILTAYDSGNYDKEIDLVMAIEPNNGHMPGLPSRAPFIKAVYEKSGAERSSDQGVKPLAMNPYAEWPAPSPRWDVQAGDVYGSGCGILALGDCRQLQFNERRKQQAIDKIVKPPLRAHASVKNSSVSHLPGGVTYWDTAAGGQKPAIEAMYEVDANALTAISNDIRENEQRINMAYFKDLFLMLAQSDRRQITAREVEEKHEEKLLALGPVLERLHNELLNPSVDRAFGIVQRAGLLPPPPKELEGINLEIEYISILAQAQRAIAVGSMERFAGMVGQMVGVVPDSLDKLDADQYLDEYADAIGVTPSIVRTDDAVAKIREDRAKAKQAEQQGMAMAQAAESAATLASAKTSEPNLLTQILGGVGA